MANEIIITDLETMRGALKAAISGPRIKYSKPEHKPASFAVAYRRNLDAGMSEYDAYIAAKEEYYA